MTSSRIGRGRIRAVSLLLFLLVAPGGAVLASEPETVYGNSAVAFLYYPPGLRDLEAVRGTADDLLLNPGLAHEPNTPWDAYPWAAFASTPSASGDHNSYTRYQEQVYDGSRGRATGHLWLDAHLARVLNPLHPGATSPLGVSTVEGSTTSEAQLLAAPVGGRPLGPGAYAVLGRVGAWRDSPTVISESVSQSPLLTALGLAAPSTTTYEVPADGWVGNVVSRTGAYRYKGYQPQECVVQAVQGTYEHALCDPFLGGTITDPQDYDHSGGEFQAACPASTMWAYLTPYQGGQRTAWVVPVFRLVDYQAAWAEPETALGWQDFTGTFWSLPLELSCEDGRLSPVDLVLFPAGDLGQGYGTELTIRTSVEAVRKLCYRDSWGYLRCTQEKVVDVDSYTPWFVAPGA